MLFELKHKDQLTKARAGIIKTSHGQIETPVFMPVGTTGSIKAVHTRDVQNDAKASIILGNTYHLFLRPGIAILEKAGGLHKFNQWHKPILTDSGGYQVYSLAEKRKITEEGVSFQSHIDGSRHFFTPEHAIKIQRSIGADIIMAFDECTPFPCDKTYAQKSMEMTHRWLKRCVNEFKANDVLYDYPQSLFGIVQGSVYKDLRSQSAKAVSDMNCEGNAIGGLSVGEPAEMMYEMTDQVTDILPAEKPRYLMGVGTPANIIECIALGVDMFDCVMPTRNGRNGMLFTKNGIINIKNNKWKDDFSVIDSNGSSFVDNYYSKAYLRHLFVANEILGPMIASLHNLSFYIWLVNQARTQILNGTFYQWKKNTVPLLEQRL